MWGVVGIGWRRRRDDQHQLHNTRQRISACTSRAWARERSQTGKPTGKPTGAGIFRRFRHLCVAKTKSGGWQGELKSFYLKGKQAPPAAELMPGRLGATRPHIMSLPCLERGCTISVGIIWEDKDRGARIMREEHDWGRVQNKVNFPRLPEG